VAAVMGRWWVAGGSRVGRGRGEGGARGKSAAR
jgi:hypothetical protein